MARLLTLEPIYVEGRASPWKLYIPAYLSETRKPQKLFFETQGQAKTAAGAFKARTENFGRTLNELSPARMAEAAEVYAQLDAQFPDVTLIEVYRIFAAQSRERTASVSFAQAFDGFSLCPKNATRGIEKRSIIYARNLSFS